MDDFTSEIGYNNAQDAKDDDVDQVIVEKIKKEDMTPITVTGCLHVNTTRVPSDEFENCDEVTCRDCPWGTFVRR